MPKPIAKPRAARKRCSKQGCRKLAPAGRRRCDDHKPGAQSPGSTQQANRKPLIGKVEPRHWTRPLRPLTRQTSRGWEVIDFAEMIGMPLQEWQKFAVIHALELLPNGDYRFRTVLIIVARQNGKSHLKRIVSLWRMYMDGATDILGVAQDLSLARKQWQQCQDAIHACPDLEEEWGGVRNVNGDEWFKAGGATYAIKAANEKAPRGGSNDEVNIDELRVQHDWKAWAACSKTTNARRNGQTWAMSNMGGEEAVVLNQLRDSALSGRNPAICILEWSAEEGCELDDWEQVCQANPGLGPGGVVVEAALRSDILNEPADIVRTEILCQKVEALNGAINPGAWKACADPDGSMEGHRGRLAATFDVAPDGMHATLCVAAKLDDGRVRVEVAGAWRTTDAVRFSKDPDAPDLATLLDTIKPAWFRWFPQGPAAELAPMLRRQASKWNVRKPKKRKGEPDPLPQNGEISGSSVTEVCQGLAGLAKARQVIHSDDPLLNAHVYGAEKLPSGDGWRFKRRGGPDAGHVDAAYAAAGAADTALTMPEPERPRIRILA